MNLRRTVALVIVAGLPIVLLAGMLHLGGPGGMPVLDRASAQKTLYLHWCLPAFAPKKATMLISTPVFPGKEINITLDGGSRSLQGIIVLKDGKYQADLKGHFCTTTGFFNGTVELDKAFMPDFSAISSVLLVMSFVLSTDPVGDRFLRESSWASPTVTLPLQINGK
jgi:hypothetical protein